MEKKVKFKIRQSVFETNSSSTHSICIVPTEDYNKFRKGELWMIDTELCTIDEVITHLKNNNTKISDYTDLEEVEDFLNSNGRDYEVYSIRNYSYNYETFATSYTTKSGDEITAFGYHGHD